MSVRSQCSFVVLSAGIAVAGATAHGAVMLNPSLYTTIDPSSGQGVDVSANNAVAAPAQISVIQNWDNFSRADAISTAGQIIAFDSATFADLKLNASGSNVASTALVAVDNRGTSQPSSVTADAVELRSGTAVTNGGTCVLSIDFGSYDGSSFDASVKGVSYAGFTVSELTTTELVTVTFYDGATVLSTQTAAGNAEGTTTSDPVSGNDVYFGYVTSGSQIIDRIVVSRYTNNTTAPRSYFDDLAFTAVPEPNSLGAFGALALLSGRRRRAR